LFVFRTLLFDNVKLKSILFLILTIKYFSIIRLSSSVVFTNKLTLNINEELIKEKLTSSRTYFIIQIKFILKKIKTNFKYT